MAVYKISYVIIGDDNPGAILNQNTLPKKGDKIKIRNQHLEVVEVLELVPPRGEFHYIHVTCRQVMPKT